MAGPDRFCPGAGRRFCFPGRRGHREGAAALRILGAVKMISVRRIRSGEAQLFKDLRLAALKESPLAFSSTYESAVERSWESWRDQADGTAAGVERCTLIAFADGTPVGIASVYRDSAETDEGELLQFWVRPNWRSRGIGRALLEALVQWGAESGVRWLWAGVAAGNDRAVRFYERQGFAPMPSLSQCVAGGTMLIRRVGADQAHADR
jgi:ribosomal protein S18 acetylase RimI-like enzyme